MNFTCDSYPTFFHAPMAERPISAFMQDCRKRGVDCLILATMKTTAERFFEKVQIANSGCWTWTACKNKFGYGSFNDGTRTPIGAHRWSYVFLKGPIPKGKVLDHLCRNPSCVNPSHLEAVFQTENVRRGKRCQPGWKCPKGHQKDGVKSNSKKYCLICNRDRERKRNGWTPAQIATIPTIPNTQPKKQVRSVLQDLRDKGEAVFIS